MRAKGHRGEGQKEGPSWAGQATKGKAGGREEKWGKEERREGEERGQMVVKSLGSGSK